LLWASEEFCSPRDSELVRSSLIAALSTLYPGRFQGSDIYRQFSNKNSDSEERVDLKTRQNKRVFFPLFPPFDLDITASRRAVQWRGEKTVQPLVILSLRGRGCNMQA